MVTQLIKCGSFVGLSLFDVGISGRNFPLDEQRSSTLTNVCVYLSLIRGSLQNKWQRKGGITISS